MTTRIRFLGVAAFEVVGPRHRILFDPFLTGSPTAPCGPGDLETPDVILVSHPPIDHLGDAAEIAIRTGAPVVCGADSRALLMERGVPAEQIRHTIWGIKIQIGDLLIRPVYCQHWAGTTLKDGSRVPGFPVSFIVEIEPGVRVYHSGDSAVFGDMRLIGQLHRPTVGLMGCSQAYALLPELYAGAGEVVTGEMDPEEAAIAAELLGVRYAIASHLDDHARANQDGARCLAAVKQHDTTGLRVPLALQPGQTLVIDGGDHRVEDALA
ncbi:MAG: MBL fold metallo-hydrolase [Chloroflexi bacterium]|nr:MBL fold metallo-hydrolase [Chloroflexota bacterium]